MDVLLQARHSKSKEILGSCPGSRSQGQAGAEPRLSPDGTQTNPRLIPGSCQPLPGRSHREFWLLLLRDLGSELPARPRMLAGIGGPCLAGADHPKHHPGAPQHPKSPSMDEALSLHPAGNDVIVTLSPWLRLLARGQRKEALGTHGDG